MDIMSEVKGLLETKGVDAVASQLKERGLDQQVSSWISTGENMPVVGSEIKQALGQEEVAQIAGRLGVTEDEAADQLAQVVPKAIDEATPQGHLAKAAKA
jgi:uncharacterized protein YidB (DUF937 family)